jgi:hypothetical protein
LIKGHETPESHSRWPATGALGQGVLGWPVCILKKLDGTEFVPKFKFTFRVRACFVFSGQTEESVTWTLKVNEPVAVVVPEIVPFAFRLSPAGSAPQEIFHRYGGVPPLAAKTVE